LKIIKLNITLIALIISSLIFTGCMEDINEPVEIKYYTSADLISYLETHGDYINSSKNPAIISVDDAYSNLSDYLLMDIRTPSQFQSGHIEGARNFGIEQLIDSLEFNNVNMEAKIIIISESGQKAAYATSLLRLYGFTNVFSLNFGMAQWNIQFADVWINARGDSEWWFMYETGYYPKPKKENKIPSIEIDNSKTTEQFAKNRIKKMLTEDEYLNAIATIQQVDATYSLRYSIFVDSFVMCYDDRDLYDVKRYFKDISPPGTWGGHPISSVLYLAQTDFKASTNLLTLPIDKTIFSYSFNGQKSLFITAYLRLLGYNAKSIHFGAVSMIYNKLLLNKFEQSFRESDIRNYPIIN